MRSVVLVGLAALVVAALAAAGSGGEATAPRPETTVYLLTADRSAPIGVRRTLARRSPFAREALRALLAGPTAAERRLGLTTAIPARTRLVSFRSDSVAVVGLTGLPQSASGVNRVRVLTQIVRSLVGLSGIERVRVRNDGRPWGLWLQSGGVDDRPLGYDDLLGWHVGGAGGLFSALP